MHDESNGYTKYEIARMVGARALQIAMGAPFLVKFSEAELEKLCYNPLEVAKIEFKSGLLPITVRRPGPKQRLNQKTLTAVQAQPAPEAVAK